jgi:hypothetical protein
LKYKIPCRTDQNAEQAQVPELRVEQQRDNARPGDKGEPGHDACFLGKPPFADHKGGDQGKYHGKQAGERHGCLYDGQGKLRENLRIDFCDAWRQCELHHLYERPAMIVMKRTLLRLDNLRHKGS